MRSGDAIRLFWDAVRRARTSRAPAGGASALANPTGAEVVRALQSLDAIRAQCRAMVTRRAVMSAGAAIVPVPGLDIGTDVAILVRLLPRVNEKFGLSEAQIATLDAESKRAVMMFVTAVGSNLIGRIVTRELVMKVLMKMGVKVTTKGVVKFVPLFGQALSASLSFGAMRFLGNRHIDDCYEVARRSLLDAVNPDTSRPARREIAV